MLLEYSWVDEGTPGDEDRLYHQSIKITAAGNSFTVSKGDVVRLFSDEEEGMAAQWFCRVLDLWETADSLEFQGQWLYKRDEVEKYKGNWEGFLKKSQVLESMRETDLVLSDHSDVNQIASIEDVVKVIYEEPETKQKMPLPPEESPPVCRYKLDTGARHTWRVLPWSPEEDAKPARSQAEPDIDDSSVSDEGEEEDSVSASSASNKNRVLMSPEGEGSKMRSDIAIGPEHQVKVGPFVPGHTVASRYPKKVWSAGMISDKDLRVYLEEVAKLQLPYLKAEGLLSNEPYMPFGAKQEDLLQLGEKLTPSWMSTASMLTDKKNSLTKECNADTVLEILHMHNGYVEAALAEVKARMTSVTSAWSGPERKIFDEGFRNSQGSLRHISRAVAPLKDHKDTVDYWFRWKIPDQFRAYQNKKREQAIRMMGCIEKRRYHTFTTNPSADNGGNNGRDKTEERRKKHWSETSVAEVTGVTEDRRQTAKKLLMDIENTLGKQVMGEVAEAIRQLHQSYTIELKDELFSLLDGQIHLQKRVMDFLPKSF